MNLRTYTILQILNESVQLTERQTSRQRCLHCIECMQALHGAHGDGIISPGCNFIAIFKLTACSLKHLLDQWHSKTLLLLD